MDLCPCRNPFEVRARAEHPAIWVTAMVAFCWRHTRASLRLFVTCGIDTLFLCGRGSQKRVRWLHLIGDDAGGLAHDLKLVREAALRPLGSLRLLSLVALIVCPPLAVQAQDHRVALVIGNSAYVNAGHLANPKNDADDIADTLGRLGFSVMKGIDLDKAGMDGIVRTFAERLSGARVGSSTLAMACRLAARTTWCPLMPSSARRRPWISRWSASI